MNVLHLIAPIALAGAERVILTFLENFDHRLLSVFVACYINSRRGQNPFVTAVEKLNVPLIKIPIGRNNLPSELLKTFHIVKHNRIDILHTHGYRSDIAGLLAARLARIPILSTVHGWTPISAKLRTYETLDRYCLKRFDKIICVSKEIRDLLRSRRIPEDKLTYLNNAVSYKRRNARADKHLTRESLGYHVSDRIILSVGRLSHEKGLPILLTAFRNQLSANENMKLVILGQGPQREKLLQMSEDLGIAGRVILEGHKDNVFDYYDIADAFVMPSLTEGSPMALLEAMAAGLPVLCTSVGGVPDIVTDGESGLLVQPGDEKSLGAAMNAMMSNPALRSQLASNAQDTVRKRFSAELWVHRIVSIYQEIAGTRLSGR